MSLRGIRYTLVTDGSSDRVLCHPIDWLLSQLTELSTDGRWADPQTFPDSRRSGLPDRLAGALESYPCDLLFVHRDAETECREARALEIEGALRCLGSTPPAVCVVPVRMTEAWLLVDEHALRTAAGNPNGRVKLELPELSRLERDPDPKRTLFDLLRRASELKGRRLVKLRLGQCRQRLAELIQDFSPLQTLSAFQLFRDDLTKVLQDSSWC